MKVLVTGGAGFIGSHLVRRLVSENNDVVVVDDLSSGAPDNIPGAAELVVGSAGDAALLDGILPGSSCIFHLAAVSSVRQSVEKPLATHANNLTVTLALLEAAVRNRVPRFVFSSSASVYGNAGSDPVAEDAPKNPLSHYAVQKLASENYCNVYERIHGLETACLRYFNVYGPGQSEDSPYTGVITKFIAAVRSGKPPVIFGDGSQSRDFVHVDDVVSANLAAARAEPERVAGEVFNIGSGESVSVGELSRLVLEKFHRNTLPRFEEPRPGEILHSRADITLSRNVLGFKPGKSLDGFLDAVASRCGN